MPCCRPSPRKNWRCAGDTLPDQRAGTAALAERDPERAWQAVKKARASMVSAAALRMLAIRDPRAALEKWKTLEPERGAEWNGENDVIHSPLGSIFAAWTRRDPAAAIAAAAALPLSDRKTAQDEIALTLASHDGPAAWGYVLPFGGAEGFRLGAILRSSFSQSRAASQAVAALLRDRPELMQNESRNFLGPWYRTDPEGAAPWATSVAPQFVDRYGLMMHDPGAVLQIVSSSRPNSGDGYILSSLIHHFPDEAKSLAEERGIWPEVEKRLQEYQGPRIDPDPTTRLKALLAKVEAHGPDQVSAAASLSFVQMGPYLDCARRYLPEAVPVLESITFPPHVRKNPGAYEDGSPLPPVEFAWDPAAAARRLLEHPVNDWDGWHAVQHWAPYDFAAAREWVNALPPGPKRQRAETALLSHSPNLSGEALLEGVLRSDLEDFLTNNWHLPRQHDLAELWQEGLRRIAHRGGDWQAWHKQIPPAYRQNAQLSAKLDSLVERLALQDSVIRELQ